MTEKRFDYTAYDDGTESIYDRKKDEYYFDMDLSKIEELMNELAEENEQLKSENNILKCALALSDVSFIIVNDSTIDIPPYYEFEDELRYHLKKEMREYDGYD